jgi:ribosome modulation factor
MTKRGNVAVSIESAEYFAREILTLVRAEKDGEEIGINGLQCHCPYDEGTDTYNAWMKGYWNEQIKRELEHARAVMAWSAGQLDEIASNVGGSDAEKLKAIAAKMTVYAG